MKVAGAIAAAVWIALLQPGPSMAQHRPSLVEGMIGNMRGEARGHRPKGPVVYGESDLKPDALKKCLVAAHELDQIGGRMSARESELGQRVKQLQHEKVLLDAERMERENTFFLLRMFKPDGGYEARAKQYNERSRAYNNEVLAQREDEFKYRQGVEMMQKDCAGKRYYPADVFALEKQLPFDLRGYLSGKKRQLSQESKK